MIGTSGGSASTTTAPATPATSTTAPVVKLAAALTASGDGIAITVAGSGTTRQPLTISGTAPATAAGGTIEIQTSPAAQPALDLGGQPRGETGRRLLSGVGSRHQRPGRDPRRARIRFRRCQAQAETGRTAAARPTPPRPVTTGTTSPLVVPIFKSAVASMYGPGFWGRHTACGQRLSRSMLGVASRTLKCGTKVEIDYRGGEITVPVIDRGPFGSRAGGI